MSGTASHVQLCGPRDGGPPSLPVAGPDVAAPGLALDREAPYVNASEDAGEMSSEELVLQLLQLPVAGQAQEATECLGTAATALTRGPWNHISVRVS